MIRHTVMFRLHHAPDSAEESSFLEDAKVLASIPSVHKFERLSQVSSKNDFAFSFSMEFADRAGYEEYNDHPLHREFVQNRWVPEVAAALEADFEQLA
jgi:hypothetical protein